MTAIVYLENAWTSNQMITEGEAAILLETTRCAFHNQSQSKQRSTLDIDKRPENVKSLIDTYVSNNYV